MVMEYSILNVGLTDHIGSCTVQHFEKRFDGASGSVTKCAWHNILNSALVRS
jgi:hypothetical protein